MLVSKDGTKVHTEVKTCLDNSHRLPFRQDAGNLIVFIPCCGRCPALNSQDHLRSTSYPGIVNVVV